MQKENAYANATRPYGWFSAITLETHRFQVYDDSEMTVAACRIL